MRLFTFVVGFVLMLGCLIEFYFTAAWPWLAFFAALGLAVLLSEDL